MLLFIVTIKHYLLIILEINQLKAYEISKTFEIACLMNFTITNCIGT